MQHHSKQKSRRKFQKPFKEENSDWSFSTASTYNSLGIMNNNNDVIIIMYNTWDDSMEQGIQTAKAKQHRSRK